MLILALPTVLNTIQIASLARLWQDSDQGLKD